MEPFENLEMVWVCNARVDTALYGLPPAKTGKKGRPRKHGERIHLDEVILNEPESGGGLIGVVPVMTNLWKGKVVYALVTAPKSGKGSRLLFFARLIPWPFPLVGRTASTKQPALTERKMSFICCRPSMA